MPDVEAPENGILISGLNTIDGVVTTTVRVAPGGRLKVNGMVMGPIVVDTDALLTVYGYLEFRDESSVQGHVIVDGHLKGRLAQLPLNGRRIIAHRGSVIELDGKSEVLGDKGSRYQPDDDHVIQTNVDKSECWIFNPESMDFDYERLPLVKNNS